MPLRSVLANSSIGLMASAIVPENLQQYASIAGAFCGALVWEVIKNWYYKKNKNDKS